MASQTISNAAAVTFPACTGGTNTITHVAIGTVAAGSTNSHIVVRKALSSSLAVSNGITPAFSIGQLTFTHSGDIGDYFQNGMLDLLFTNTASLPYVGDATGLQGSSTAGSFYVSLHTADPGATGDQTTNEATYTDYARVAVARSGSGWTLA